MNLKNPSFPRRRESIGPWFEHLRVDSRLRGNDGWAVSMSAWIGGA
jgi:hypothetical protein